MSLAELKSSMPDYAKDIKLNLGSVFNESNGGGLTVTQMAGIALACAYATRNQKIIKLIGAQVSEVLGENEINAAKAAATIMAMNNIYYRFLHMAEDSEYQKMPAGLRMNIIANPGVDKTDFELYSIAVSALNGCGMCINAHAAVLTKAGVSKAGIQAAVKIAAVINASAQVDVIEQ